MGALAERNAPASPHPLPTETRRVGRYELCFELASGGMGTVYLARATGPAGFEKLVALKTIHPHLARMPEFVDMFLDEARIASRITHANVCSAFEVGAADGVHFLAMDYLHGEPLLQVITTASRQPALCTDPRWPLLIAKIVADACEGLHAAHELRGSDGTPLDVVHRDISPSNLFVTYDGGVRVVDFGIARAAGRLQDTSTGVLKGKIGYMPPERIANKPTDRRADIWSLGVVMWEALAGERLFRRESEVDTLLSVAHEPVPAPSSILPTVAPELDAIVLRALERSPDRRYATARDLGRDLHGLLVASGVQIGTAELAEWMHAVFADSKARKDRMIERARTGVAATPSDPAPSPILAGVEPPTSSRVTSRASLAAPTRVPAAETASVHLPQQRRWQVVAGALLVLGSVAVLVVLAWPVSTIPTSRAGRARPDGAPAAAASAAGGPAPEARGVPIAAEQVVPSDAGVVTAAGDAGARVARQPVASEPAPGARRREGTRASVEGTPARSAAEVARGPEAPQVEPPRAPEAMGSVDVATPSSWADVWVDGARRGRTPTRLTLPAGPHRIELRRGGLTLDRRTVSVPAGGRTRVVVPVAP